jgi:hypothetical protein
MYKYTAMSYAPRKVMVVRIGGVILNVLATNAVDLRNKSWKSECVGSFNMRTENLPEVSLFFLSLKIVHINFIIIILC